MSKQQLRKVKRHYKKLMELLRELGLKEDTFFIRLEELIKGK